MFAVTLEQNVTWVLDEEDSAKNSARPQLEGKSAQICSKMGKFQTFSYVHFHLFDIFFSLSGGYESA